MSRAKQKGHTNARVERVCPLTDSIIELLLEPETYIDYQAGQYLQIQIGEHLLSYSIANAPLGSHKYELHIRHDKNNLSNQALFDEIKAKGILSLHLPLGSTHLQALDASMPIIFIAGGTGFAPIKAMIEQLMAQADSRPFELYWSARSQSDLYMDDKIRTWASHVEHFCYFSMVTTGEKKEMLTSSVIEQHIHNLTGYQIVIAGPFDMALAARDLLLRNAILPSQLYSDAF